MTSASFTGIAIKIAYEDDIDLYLKTGDPVRPMGRYNRPGQDAFYASENLNAAQGALRNFTPDPARRQVLLSYQIAAENLFDIRQLNRSEAESYLEKWKPVVAQGGIPKSWIAADTLRAEGYDGLIDPSRANASLFHIVLFRWNQKDAPKVARVGDPHPYEGPCKM
jgi:RES domain-containing protein